MADLLPLFSELLTLQNGAVQIQRCHGPVPASFYARSVTVPGEVKRRLMATGPHSSPLAPGRQATSSSTPISAPTS